MAAAVAAFYGLIVGVFIYKEIKPKELTECFAESCVTSSVVIVLIGMAAILCNIMTLQKIPVIVAEYITSISDNRIIILLLINIMLLITGTFMECSSSNRGVPTPPFIAGSNTADPIHFGVTVPNPRLIRYSASWSESLCSQWNHKDKYQGHDEIRHPAINGYDCGFNPGNVHSGLQPVASGNDEIS